MSNLNNLTESKYYTAEEALNRVCKILSKTVKIKFINRADDTRIAFVDKVNGIITIIAGIHANKVWMRLHKNNRMASPITIYNVTDINDLSNMIDLIENKLGMPPSGFEN